MKIAIGYGDRQQPCTQCLQVINAQDKAIRLTESNTYIHKIYHVDCFIKFISWYYEYHPYEKKIRGFGRPRLGLTEEQYKNRLKLLKSRTRWTRKKKELVALRKWDQAEIVQQRIDEIAELLKEQVGKSKI